MSEFCKCRSIKINGNCSNKSCKEHRKSLLDPATYEQINYIKNLSVKLGTHWERNEFISKVEASKIIEKLLERLEMGIG